MLDTLDRIARGHRVEDHRLELKAEWPDPTRSARRLAGHANSAQGDWIVWIVGVDERTGTCREPSSVDTASHWASMQACFDGVTPELVLDLRVPRGQGCVQALLFDTSRAPFVVKNPAGGAVQLEVPWREATAVRSARREDLLRILVPRLQMPDVDLLRAEIERVTPEQSFSRQAGLRVNLTLYITPHSTAQLVVPKHRMTAVLKTTPGPHTSWTATCGVHVTPLGEPGSGTGIEWTGGELIIRGPGGAIFTADTPVSESVSVDGIAIDAYLILSPVRSADPVAVRTRFLWADAARQWFWRGDRIS